MANLHFYRVAEQRYVRISDIVQWGYEYGETLAAANCHEGAAAMREFVAALMAADLRAPL